MIRETVDLKQDVQRAMAALQRTLAKFARQDNPPWAQLTRSVPGIGGEEVFVLVLGASASLVSQTRMPGRKISLRELKLRLAGAESAVNDLAAGPSIQQAAPLAMGEAALLDQAGFREQDAQALAEVSAIERARIDFEVLVRDSLTLEQAGKLLQVSTGRLRQRLGPRERTLYGFKEGRTWRIPRFQLDRKGGLVRGIDRVVPAIGAQAHPLAVARWFSTPHQDLVVGAEEAQVTPRAWLAAGLAPETVARLAREI